MLRRNEFDSVIADCDEAIRLDSTYAIAYVNRGAAWSKKQDSDRALDDLNHAISLAPTDAAAYRNRGVVWSDRHDSGRAINDYTTAIRLDPQCAKPYFDRGVEWDEQGQLDKAIDDYTQAIRLDRTTLGLTTIAAAVGRQRSSLKRRLRTTIKPFESTQITPRPHANRGLIWAWTKQCKTAIADYDKAIQLDSSLCKVYGDRGWCRLELKEYDKAIADFDLAIRHDPHAARQKQAVAGRGAARGSLATHAADFDEACPIRPEECTSVYKAAAWLAATCTDAKYRDGGRAVRLATKACELTSWTDADALDTLAAAYAEAATMIRQPDMSRRPASGNPATAISRRSANRRKLALYKDHKPYREE